MNKKLKVLYKKVGCEPEILEIKDELKVMQRLVDGLIEVVTYNDDVLIICNDEGKLLNMKPNIQFDYDYIAGDCFFVGDDFENAGFKDLTDNQIEEVRKMLEEKSITYDSLDEEKEI